MTFPEAELAAALFEQDAPGVDLVIANDNNHEVTVLSRRLIGSMHRRLLSRFVALRRELDSGYPLAVARSDDATSGLSVDRTLNFVSGVAPTWDARTDIYGRLNDVAAARIEGERVGVRIRGWNEQEAAILVDGRAVPACIVDLVVAAVAFVDPLRDGEQALGIFYPQPTNVAESQLWDAAFQLCQDRLGIERGVLVATWRTPEHREAVSAIA